jgi:hypothetical protein
MKIYKRPGFLWALILSTLLVIPLSAMNLSVIEKAPLVKAVLKPSNLRLLLFISGWSVLNALFVAKARWVSFWSSGILAGVLLYGNVYLLFSTKNYSLAFFALGLLILTIFYSVNLFQSLSMVYFDPGRRWHESYPRFIPNIEVSILHSAGKSPARISRIGLEGCFVYTNDATVLPTSVEISLIGPSQRTFKCPVSLVSKTKDKKGLGLQFNVTDNDTWKELNDFIDRVRSFGYA